MNSIIRHPDSETLLRLADGDLSTTESTEIGRHLDRCGDCRDRLNAVREALDDYGRFHRDVLKPSFSPPPDQWRPLPFPKTRPRSFRPVRWLAAAAAIAALVLVVRRFEQSPEVRAAELLRKASAAERAAPASSARIRIRTRSRTMDRDARVKLGEGGTRNTAAPAIQELFDAAEYSWENPLSVQAFSGWRDRLPEKQDRIEESGDSLLVRTFARGGVIADASLSLRRTDLHAFACTFRFRAGGEIIYVTELPDATPIPPEAATASAQPAQASPIAPAKTATPGDEMRVIAALHGIGADLGEPVEVLRDGASIVVHVSGLTDARRDQIRAALSGVPEAQLRFEDIPPGASPSSVAPPHSAVPSGKPNPLIADLATRATSNVSISDLSDELIDVTDRAAERAFSLRALARRFPPEATFTLSQSEIEILRGIIRDHTGAFATAMRELRRLVARILPDSSPPAPPSTPAPWQAIADGLPAAVDRLDRTLNGATDASDARKAQLAQSIADLDRRIDALQLAVRD